MWNRALAEIRSNDGVRVGFNYVNSRSKVQHTLTMYTLRPLPHISKILDTQLSDIIPDNFNPAYTIGLPVRGEFLVLGCCEARRVCRANFVVFVFLIYHLLLYTIFIFPYHSVGQM